ncbi:MAG TPA: hypothetical protein VG271_17295 [Beijerinckiaceae bacterium]|nr:hypothetical protein [Beijerinckiaceae bacterium]
MTKESEKVEGHVDDISADLANLRADVAKLTATVTDLLKHQASFAQDRVMGAVDSAREQITNSAADAQQRVRSASAELESAIERNPLAAVAVAMLCGWVLGRMGRDNR